MTRAWIKFTAKSQRGSNYTGKNRANATGPLSRPGVLFMGNNTAGTDFYYYLFNFSSAYSGDAMKTFNI